MIYSCSICYKPIDFSGKKPETCGGGNCLKEYWGLK